MARALASRVRRCEALDANRAPAAWVAPDRRETDMAKRLTRYILFALVLGVIAGWAINAAIDDGTPRERRAAEVDRRISEHRHRAVPAPDQDDHRAAGLLDPGRGHRPHGRHRRARPGRRALARLVHPRHLRLADLGPDPGQRASSGRRPQPADPACDRGERGRDRRLQPQGIRHPRRAGLDLRGDEHATRSCRSSSSRSSSGSR